MVKAIFEVGAILILLHVLNGVSVGQQVIVLDGLGGMRGRYMQPEVNRLTSVGYDVIYRPWWRWRSALRTAPRATRVIGFSMGAPRAIEVAQSSNATRLELVDPVSRRIMQVPAGISTTVYRATGPSRIRSTTVQGIYQQNLIPTNHMGMPTMFRN